MSIIAVVVVLVVVERFVVVAHWQLHNPNSMTARCYSPDYIVPTVADALFQSHARALTQLCVYGVMAEQLGGTRGVEGARAHCRSERLIRQYSHVCVCVVWPVLRMNRTLVNNV